MRKSTKLGISKERIAELLDDNEIRRHQIKTKKQVERLFHALAVSVRKEAILRKAGLL